MNRLAVGAGLALLVGAGGCALVYLFVLAMALAGAPAQVDAAVALGALAWLAAGAGLGLAGSARPSGPAARFGPRNPLLWLWAFGLALMAGSAVLGIGQTALTGLAFPVVHAFGAVAPALVVAAYVAWRAGGPAWLTWRGVVTGVVAGGAAATAIAAVLEVAAAAGLAGLTYAALRVAPGGPEALRRLGDALDAAVRDQALDPAALVPALHPVVIAAVLAFFALVGPAVEELAKAAVVVVRRPATPVRAWAWGATTGAGFGIVEAVMFGAMGASAAGWAVAMMARACATLMHATMTGLAVLGWQRAALGGQRRAGLALLAAAIAGHGAWNALVVTAVLGALGGETLGRPALTTVGSLAGAGIVAGFAGICLGFLRLSRSLPLEAQEAQPVEHDHDGAALVPDDAERQRDAADEGGDDEHRDDRGAEGDVLLDDPPGGAA